MGKVPTFLGVAVLGLVTDHAHDVGLLAVLIQGIAHRLAIDGQTFIFPRVAFVPASEGTVQARWLDADQHIADDVFTGHLIAALSPTAAESPPGLGAQALGPIGDGLVAAHATQHGTGCDAQHRRQAMALALGAAGIGNLGKKRGQGLHLRGGEDGFRLSYSIR
jgi:hypothetical protein